jgi:hypothetical protein
MLNNVNYIVVGSHDPTLACSMDASPASLIGVNHYAMPYHATASTAKNLIDDIGSTNVLNIQRYIRGPVAGVEVYTGSLGTPDPDFGLQPGESYIVTMLNTTPYTPSHY